MNNVSSYLYSLTVCFKYPKISKNGNLLFFPVFLSQETLLYNPDSFHLAYRIKLAFKLRNMEKTWGKKWLYQKCNYRLLFINLHSPNRHPVQTSKGWKGHQSPSDPYKPRVVSYKKLLRGLGSRDNNFLLMVNKKSILIYLVYFSCKSDS